MSAGKASKFFLTGVNLPLTMTVVSSASVPHSYDRATYLGLLVSQTWFEICKEGHSLERVEA